MSRVGVPDEEHGFACFSHRLHRCNEAVTNRIVGVVPDPGFKQVAENVKRVGVDGLRDDQVFEFRDDRRARGVEVEVGDEEGGHESSCISKWGAMNRCRATLIKARAWFMSKDERMVP
jgi:hypothetical protein